MPGNVLAIVLSYLIGAVPLGLVLVRVIKGVDIRDYGSGKIGASNVLRLVGVPAAVLVFAFDAGKGIIAILLVKAMGDAVWAEAAAAFAALVGHNWSAFIRFSGGRGVSTGLGALFIMAPLWGLVCARLWADRSASVPVYLPRVASGDRCRDGHGLGGCAPGT